MIRKGNTILKLISANCQMGVTSPAVPDHWTISDSRNTRDKNNVSSPPAFSHRQAISVHRARIHNTMVGNVGLSRKSSFNMSSRKRNPTNSNDNPRATRRANWISSGLPLHNNLLVQILLYRDVFLPNIIFDAAILYHSSPSVSLSSTAGSSAGKATHLAVGEDNAVPGQDPFG